MEKLLLICTCTVLLGQFSAHIGLAATVTGSTEVTATNLQESGSCEWEGRWYSNGDEIER